MMEACTKYKDYRDFKNATSNRYRASYINSPSIIATRPKILV